MKDLGVADVILGIRIHRTPQGLALSQSHYIENVLDKFKYMEFGIAKTPLDVSFALQRMRVKDPLTKGLFRGVERTSKGMGLRPRTSQHDGYVSPKSDVYVFSMLLVELITKKEFDYSFFYTKECRKENLVDESFKEVDLQTGSRITNLTYRCTNTEPEERPTMKDVLDVLKEATKMGAKGRKRERDENEDGSQGGETKKR
ncbi:hypothetical protein CQW23_16316 [Capsicum baccatum]|uniref:non-specific serine/threonine protein kinase n=1 Tax=Capsicum baccatum TaxID=33114 RepID=A0A2G2WAL5_CAPBA|nr:hypothetical protein CQW23_16316 [Capsicum baccatum]